jgi:DNA-binding FrmR family transcriptional regulator
MDEETRSKAVERLRRIAGQVSGIQRMLAGGRQPADVLLQVAAAHAALGETGRVILSGHVDQCLAEAIRDRDPLERRRQLSQLVNLLSRFLRVDELHER